MALTSLLACSKQERLNYPLTAKTDVSDNYFGTTVADPYRWLENDTSAQTEAWVVEQNKVTFDYLAKIPFREQLKQRLTELWNYPRIGAPFKEGGKYFYYKNDGLQNQSVLYMQDELGGPSVVALDPNTLSEDGTVALTGLSVSPDGKYMAYSIAHSGSDWNEILIREIATGKDLPDHLKWVKWSGMSWFKNGFYYSRYPEPAKGMELSGANEFHRACYHQLGTSQDMDILVYEDREHPQRSHTAYVTEDEQIFCLNKTEGTQGNSLWIKDANMKNAEFTKIYDGLEFDYNVIEHIGDELIIRTNDQAPRYKLISFNLKTKIAKDLIAEKENVLRGVSVIGGMIAVSYMQDARSKVEMYNIDGSFAYELELPGIGTCGGLNGKKDETMAFYTFTSYTVPPVIYQFDVKTKESKVYFKPDVPFNIDEFVTDQVFYTSKDGTKIPMFITYKKGMERTGENPTLLYGYGGFNASMTPGFTPRRMVWLENGGILAVACLRGGGEYGEEWHQAGTKLKKQNVFDDCIAAAEYLIAEKYTNPSKLALKGGSNGGTLVGAVINQRPELFKVALPMVGVMDMLRYHLFTIGYAWAGDYGTSADSIHFKNLYAYSPLHNLREGVEYPAVMVTTADHDDRVVPAHSFKYAATLQEKYKGSNPVIIRIESKAGHGGGMPTAKQIEEFTDVWSFVFYNMGITPEFKK